MTPHEPRPTPGPPVVDLKAWTDTEALVIVNGTRVRARRNRTGARWICDEHGSDSRRHALQRGIGLEAMTNAAAARTYSVLAGEGRRVVAGFAFPA